MIVSTYLLSNNRFSGNYEEDNVPDNRGISSVMYQNQFLIGFWNGSEWIEGATQEEMEQAIKLVVPTQARSMNLRLVLIQNGISIQSVYDTIASLPSPNNELGYQMFEYATHYDRNNPMINTLAQLMNISQEQLDQFFIQAENLIV